MFLLLSKNKLLMNWCNAAAALSAVQGLTVLLILWYLLFGLDTSYNMVLSCVIMSAAFTFGYDMTWKKNCTNMRCICLFFWTCLTYSIIARSMTSCSLTSESIYLSEAMVVMLRLLPMSWLLTVLVFAFVHDVVVGWQGQWSPSVPW